MLDEVGLQTAGERPDELSHVCTDGELRVHFYGVVPIHIDSVWKTKSRHCCDRRVHPFLYFVPIPNSVAPEKKERQAARSPRQSEGGKGRKRRQVSTLLSRDSCITLGNRTCLYKRVQLQFPATLLSPLRPACCCVPYSLISAVALKQGEHLDQNEQVKVLSHQYLTSINEDWITVSRDLILACAHPGHLHDLLTLTTTWHFKASLQWTRMEWWTGTPLLSRGPPRSWRKTTCA